MAGTDTSWLDGHVASSAGVGQLFQVVLGIEGGRASRSGGGDRLPVGVVDQVSAGEHASQVGPGAAPPTDDIARLVEGDGPEGLQNQRLIRLDQPPMGPGAKQTGGAEDGLKAAPRETGPAQGEGATKGHGENTWRGAARAAAPAHLR